jgi:hypothetical protein
VASKVAPSRSGGIDTSIRLPELPRLCTEALLVGAVYGAYDATRDLRHSDVATANRRNARLLLDIERHSHRMPEHALSQILWHLPGLAVPAAYFYATLHFIVTPAVLI